MYPTCIGVLSENVPLVSNFQHNSCTCYTIVIILRLVQGISEFVFCLITFPTIIYYSGKVNHTKRNTSCTKKNKTYNIICHNEIHAVSYSGSAECSIVVTAV